MATTLPDVKLIKTSYLDLYQLTGITVGTPLILQNKSSVATYVQIKSSAPSATSTDGNIIVPNGFLIVKGGTITGCFAIGSGSLSVQIMD